MFEAKWRCKFTRCPKKMVLPVHVIGATAILPLIKAGTFKFTALNSQLEIQLAFPSNTVKLRSIDRLIISP